MAFSTAFQRNAFQNNAFQIRTGDIGGAMDLSDAQQTSRRRNAPTRDRYAG